MNDEIETLCDDEVICPWCGHSHRDLFDMIKYEEGEERHECSMCEKPFELSTTIRYRFETRRLSREEILAEAVKAKEERDRECDRVLREQQGRRALIASFVPGQTVLILRSKHAGRVVPVANHEMSASMVLLDVDGTIVGYYPHEIAKFQP